MLLVRSIVTGVLVRSHAHREKVMWGLREDASSANLRENLLLTPCPPTSSLQDQRKQLSVSTAQSMVCVMAPLAS